LTIVLICKLENENTSTASIRITTNGPPSPGFFVVMPKDGFALNTSFVFSASQWTDDDIPISFDFGFIDSTNGAKLIIQSKSEVSFGKSLLSAGAPSDNNSANCFVRVYDDMSAVSTLETVVTIMPQQFSPSQLSTIIDNQLTAGAGNLDATKQVLATASSTLSMIDCAGAKNCNTLYNRYPCSSVVNTCGPCISDLYIGEEGHANSICQLISTFQQQLNSSPFRCGNDKECDMFSYCNVMTESCIPLSKSCIGGMFCSGHGSCIYKSMCSGQNITNCFYGDESCKAECKCSANYSGIDCSQTLEDLMIKQQLRSALIFLFLLLICMIIIIAKKL
jgi:hypothetical protein